MVNETQNEMANETKNEIKDRIADILDRAGEACARSGRSLDDVTLVAVTKTFPVEKVVEAAKSGLVTHFGENRVQELQTKVPAFPSEILRPTWHLIGHLQRNKARKALALANKIDSLDSVELAMALERICAEENSPCSGMEVLIEVNSSGEASKTGAPWNEVPALVDAVRESCPHLKLAGLMTIGPLNGDETAVKKAFEATRQLRDRLKINADDMPRLSMGMSGDFEWAIEQGSTEIRVGSAIFGHR